jgi:Mce-associated membrane protein
MSPADRPDDDPLAEPAEHESDVTDTESDDLDAELDDLDADAESDAADATDAEPAQKAEPRWPTMVLAGALAFAVAAGAVALWFGVKWVNAANDDSLAYSKVRDDVARVATAAVITVNSLDYRTVDEDLRDWADATTGTLHDEIEGIDDATRKTATDSKSVGSAKVHSLAVRELDERAGRAVVIAAVQLDVTVEGQEPVAKYQRLEAAMTRVDGEWKLESIGQVPFTPGQ